MRLKAILALSVLFTTTLGAETYWKLDPASMAIEYSPAEAGPHSDHLEMSGKQIPAVVRYGVRADGSLALDKSLVWPGFRTIPNDTHGSLMRHVAFDVLDELTIERQPAAPKVEEVRFDGLLTITQSTPKDVKIERTLFPSVEHPMFVERVKLTNVGREAVDIEIPALDMSIATPAARGVDGSYRILTTVEGARTLRLEPGSETEFAVVSQALREGDKLLTPDVAAEEAARRVLVGELTGTLVLDTPDEMLDRMFAMSKIRACESIYETKGGPLHGPGGETYYAAIWANDEAEYANPFFAFTGYAYADSSAMNSFRHFARFMNPDYKPIPSSIVAEGADIWNGAGDRGDAAMIAYGASRYALASGSRKVASELWPLIEWCLEYCRRNLNSEGVVRSDHDELEGRFPAGEANLCTSSLYYDALLSAAMLACDLEMPSKTSASYRRQAAELAKAIDSYFAGPVEGFDTYAYYKGNDRLRSWICIPLTVGINDKLKPTLDALFSPELWTENGLLTQSGTSTFWDRSTLYALRGVLQAGAVERAIPYLTAYSTKRLTGDHVPYAIEAWPEGNQRHLSAESALYARIFTEGMFGIRPTGLKRFEMTPRLPKEWPSMALRNIKAFGENFDIEVSRRDDGRLDVRVISAGEHLIHKTINDGGKFDVKF